MGDLKSKMSSVNIKGFEHYLISVDGTVFAPHVNKCIKSYDNGLGYRAVKLRNTEGQRKQFYVHRLVALTFIENALNLTDVNHKDGVKTNNNVSNLEWTSHSANLKHAFENDLLRGFILARASKYR